LKESSAVPPAYFSRFGSCYTLSAPKSVLLQICLWYWSSQQADVCESPNVWRQYWL